MKANIKNSTKKIAGVTVGFALASAFLVATGLPTANAAVPTGTVRLQNVNSAMSLAVDGASTANAAKVIQSSTNSSSSQSWVLKAVAGTRYVTIVNAASGKCLSDPSSSRQAGTQLIQWTCANYNDQQWRLRPHGGGGYSILNRESGQAIDVPGGSKISGTGVIQWPANRGANQLFELIASNSTSSSTSTSVRPTTTTVKAVTTTTVRPTTTTGPKPPTTTTRPPTTSTIKATTPTTTKATTTTVQPATLLPVGLTGAWALKFDDEFNGTTVDTSRWSTMEGGHMNNVTTTASNLSVSGGSLHLTLASSASGAEVCSSADCGAGTNAFSLPVGGYAEARVYFPGDGRSLYNWPAWWSSGPNWPTAGENDIAEVLGGQLTVNYHSSSGAHNQGAVGGYMGNGYHVYGIHRLANRSDVYWDGQLVKSYATDDNNQPQALILNVGNGGAPQVFGSASQVNVDYVRAWTAK